MLRRLLMMVLVWLWSLSGWAEVLPGATPPASAALSSERCSQLLARRRRRPRRRRPRRRKPAPPPAAPAAATPAPAPSPGGQPLGRVGGTTRIEFEGQLIKGQTTKAGEVQVLERRDTELKSMVKRRTSFRQEIIHTVFPDYKK